MNWWALLADLYTPVLVAACLFHLWRSTRIKKRYARFEQTRALQGLLASIAFIYLLWALDGFAQLWPQLGLDYSTHSALAFCLVSFLALIHPSGRLVSCLSLAGYAFLMIYLGYHSMGDILSTLLVCLLPVLWLQSWGLKERANKPAGSA